MSWHQPPLFSNPSSPPSDSFWSCTVLSALRVTPSGSEAWAEAHSYCGGGAPVDWQHVSPRTVYRRRLEVGEDLAEAWAVACMRAEPYATSWIQRQPAELQRMIAERLR